MTNPEKPHSTNILAPRGRTMKREVRVIMLILFGWLSAIIGFQLIVVLLERHYLARLNDLTFFNLPLHFWLTGQLLPLWFVLLCVVFNLWIDRHTPPERDGSLHFSLPAHDRQDGGE